MQPTTEIKQFISDREGFVWRKKSGETFELTSQVWRGAPWQHSVVVVAEFGPASTAVLYITGGDPNALDLEEARRISSLSGLPVAMLFHIPNQPLFDMWEDDLIAHTFEQFIDTGDTEWPLLFPMTRSVVRCMDMLEQAHGIENFVVIGASKRGWTTWLAAGTGDSRIIGIAPMVIDNLDVPAQMRHQVESWGTYSEQIKDYTERNLQSQIDSERGAHLTRMMDPINYLGEIKCPILIVNGANDRYWTVDALSLYWDALAPSKRCFIVPNAGHLLGDKKMMIESVAAFAYACSLGETLPEVSAQFVRSQGRISASVITEGAFETQIWMATSASLDFRDSHWSAVGNNFEMPAENTALFAQASYGGPTGAFSLSTPVKVFRK